MAVEAHSTPASTVPATREDFDQALCQAQTIALIISYLADVSDPPNSAFGWLAEELNARLERIEVADMTMRSARA